MESKPNELKIKGTKKKYTKKKPNKQTNKQTKKKCKINKTYKINKQLHSFAKSNSHNMWRWNR